MAIKHKRKSTADYIWQSSDLADGQIGVNTADGTLHALKTDNSIAQFPNSPDVNTIVSVTQVAYDALTPNANTLYLISG